jgi:hypothetical protein
MKVTRQVCVMLSGTAAFALMSVAAQAQVGSGWTSTSVSYTTQRAGCGSISGGTFSLTCSNTSGEQRAERRYQTLSSGQRQFEGYVRISSMGGDRISVAQCFGSGPHSILAYKKPGTLYQVQGGATLGSLAIGSTMRVNSIIRNSGPSQAQWYLNGSLKNTVQASGPWYNKLGAYRTASGRGPVTVNWSSIRFWRKS